MKTILIPLIGDPIENLYQLGLKEREAFYKIEKRIFKLLSVNNFVQFGQEIMTRARILMMKKDDDFFDQCLTAYAEGLGIELSRYQTFIALFDIAAHYGQSFPELKGMLPGCSSVFTKNEEGISHTRLLDFPLTGIFEDSPRLYFWQQEGKPALLTYSCEGMAPLFFQGVHASGISFALHHKPGKSFHKDGQSIFKIAFESLFNGDKLSDFKKNIKKSISITKWSFIILDKEGQIITIDIDGPNQNSESYNLNETSPLIFTNIPIQREREGFESFLKFSEERQTWIKEKLKHQKNQHILDTLTNIDDQKLKKWLHPGSTLSTVGAYHINLTKGLIDVKEGQMALVSSDSIVRFFLDSKRRVESLKDKAKETEMEQAWKKASKAQSFFDQGNYDIAYHELQMAIALMPHQIWKEILSFYLCVWDFKFINNPKELSLIYKKMKTITLPDSLKDQLLLFLMRLEKRLELSPTVSVNDISPHLRELFTQEASASKAVFATWMKLIYPRLEILDIFSPHNK